MFAGWENTRTNTQQLTLKSPNLNRRPFICTTEKGLNNFVLQ